MNDRGVLRMGGRRCAVVMPSIVPRRRSREITIAQIIIGAGTQPIIVEQPEDMPYGHASCAATARMAIGAGLDTGADAILHIEDDIDIDPRLWGQLDTDIRRGASVSYWHPKSRHGCTPRRMVGSLAVLLTARAARHLVRRTDTVGTDIAMREVADEVHPTALVEHRPGRRYASGSQMQVTSDCYRGPHVDDIARRVMETLPTRRDRMRVTTPSGIAAAIGASQSATHAAIVALTRCGLVESDGTHLWAPPPIHPGHESLQEALC